MTSDLDVVGKVLAGRLQDLAAVLARHDSFVVRPEAPGQHEPSGPPDPAIAEDIARDLVLRMLATAASPGGSALLRELADQDQTTRSLAERLGRPRLTVWEQVNDLVQVGLAGHDGGEDRVGLTPAGLTMAALIEDLVAATAGGPTR